MQLGLPNLMNRCSMVSSVDPFILGSRVNKNIAGVGVVSAGFEFALCSYASGTV